MTGAMKTTAFALLTTTALAAAPAMAATSSEAQGCDMQFSAVDADGNGRVSQDEAGRYIDQRFARFDADGDKAIDRDEYMQCMQNVDRMNREAFDEARENPEGQDLTGGMNRDAVFDAVDANHDRGIDRAEWAGAADRAWSSKPLDDTAADGPKAEQMTGDAGSDAMLGEYVWGSMSDDDGERNQDWAADRADRTFDAYDADGDGTLTRAEWNAEANDVAGGMRETAESSAEGSGGGSGAAVSGDHRISASFSELDADSNGEVSVTEYRQAQSKAWDDASSRTDDGEGVPVTLYRLFVL